MARRRTLYDVDTRTKILDTHTQFRGGLKTVDTDDSVKDFFLRDVENISLSEFGFLERRYGLVDDFNFEQLVDVVNEVTIPYSNDVFYKDRLQGYFEYVRKDKVRESIIFYNGRLYVNGVLITKLYTYPSDFDPILGRFNNNIDPLDFANYIDRVHPNLDFDPSRDYNEEEKSFLIDNIFNTGRQVEGVRIDDRMFFFTGVYPIVYEGTGEFYLLPEYVTNFEQLALFSHNLHTANLDKVYTEGFAPRSITTDANELTKVAFGEIGYSPMYPYMQGTGSGLTIKVKYKTPNIDLFTNQNNIFSTFLLQDQPVTDATAGSQYIELVPEVYYRPSGLSGTELENTWTRVPQKNVLYDVLNNIGEGSVSENFAYLNDDPEREAIDKYRYPSFLDIDRALQGVPLTTAEEAQLDITITDLPSGLYDILIDYVVYQAGYRQITVGQDQGVRFVEEQIALSSNILRNITITKEKTTDYIRIQTDDEGNEIPTPVYDPAALWTCNRVLNHYGKLMAYGSLIHPERVFIGHPTFIHYFPWFFTRDFENDAQEPLQQITPFMNILVVQSETYTWGLKGIDAVLGAPNFYTPFVISPIYGTIAPKSVRPVRNQLFFLSQDGIVSIQSLYAIDEQYNVKPIDKNIENIVPLDPEAVAIQYDNQYWIHFPNTQNSLTLRYHVDLKAWMKDTYFEYNGLDENNRPKLSQTIFNGVHKYLREDDKLVLITNPMKQIGSSDFTEDDQNYRIRRLYVDYTIATDLKETPRALFETSFLDQDYSFNEKKYLEEKMQFTIQNEYHLGKEPIFRDESIVMEESEDGQEDYTYTLYDMPLTKNHDYELFVPQQNLSPITDPNDPNNIVYPNQKANIKRINVRLFDILSNEIKTLSFSPNKAAMPSIENFLTFPANGAIEFSVFNNDIVDVNVTYTIRSTAPGNVGIVKTGSLVGVEPQRSVRRLEADIPFGPGSLEVVARRVNQPETEDSEPRIFYFQLEDGVYDEFTFEPVIPSLPPIQLSGIPSDSRGGNEANQIVVTWQDQNAESDSYRVSYLNKTTGSSILGTSPPITDKTYTISFNDAAATATQNNIFEIRVEAFFNGIWSPAASIDVTLQVFSEIPNSITSITDAELRQNQQLRFFWTDVLYESQYEVYWQYTNEGFDNTLTSYPIDRKLIFPQNISSILFDTQTPSNRPVIIDNAVVEVRVRGINSNGVSATVPVKQGVYRNHYNIANFVTEPVNGSSGFRVTIPDALKQTPYGNGSFVFENKWEVQYRKVGTTLFTTALIDAEGSNSFEVVDLDPETEYDVRVRGRYLIDGVLESPLDFTEDLIFQVTTGEEQAAILTTPNITNITVVQDPDNKLSFTLTNTSTEKAKVHYIISTNANITDVPDSASSTSELNAGASQNLSGFALVANSTYYIYAKSYPGAGVTSLPSTVRKSSSFTTPAFVTASFLNNGTFWGTQSGYAVSPNGFYVTGPANGLPSGATGWNPSVPRYIFANTTFTAVYPAPPPPPPKTATPSTTAISSTSSSVTFGITNNDSSTATITWQIVGPGGGAVASGSQSVSAFNGFQAVATGLSSATTYSLTSVIATAAGKDPSDVAPTRSLTTEGALSVPSAPTFVEIQATGGPTYRMDWNSVSGATSYDYQISTSSSFTSTIVNSNTTSLSYSGAFSTGQRIYGRVRAKNSAGVSGWVVADPVTGVVLS